MKVLIVTGSYPLMRCGVGDYSYNLAKALSTIQGIQVSVLTSILAGKIKRDDGVDFFPVIKNWGLYEVLKVIKTIRYCSPDIIHLQYPAQGYGSGLLPCVLPMLSFLMRKKIVQTWHEGHSRRDALKLLLLSIIPSKLVVVRPQYREKILHPSLRWALWKKEPLFIRNASCVPRADLSQEKSSVLKKQYLKQQRRLIVFFGFIYPHKRVELLFEIANPDSDQIVIAGEIGDKDYLNKIMRCASAESWAGKVTITDFLSEMDAAELLSVTDAVILPFRGGGGEWNSSIHGAVLNRAFVITTSTTRNGYDEKNNIYFAGINDIQEMRSALAAYGGTRRKHNPDIDRDEWLRIAEEHCLLYKKKNGE